MSGFWHCHHGKQIHDGPGVPGEGGPPTASTSSWKGNDGRPTYHNLQKCRRLDLFRYHILYLYVQQIVCGMKVLEKEKIIHRDLATRNIMLDKWGKVHMESQLNKACVLHYFSLGKNWRFWTRKNRR